MLKHFLFIQGFQLLFNTVTLLEKIPSVCFGSKIDTGLNSTNQTGMNKVHKGFHMHNRTYPKRL